MEVESPVEEVDTPPLDIRHLLVSSLQGAASRLEDDDDQASAKEIAQRVRSRIEWLRLALLGSIHHGSFIEVLAKRMLPLLEEQDSFAHNACGWVQREALATSGLQAGGTFQRALWIKLRASVEPILTEVLSAIDCCSNAKHFVSEEAWIHHLAVAILSDSDIVPLRFDNEILRAKLSHRAPVRNVGARDHFFECMFPFSWLVKVKVDTLMTTARSVAEESGRSLLECLRSAVNESPLGRIMSDFHEVGEQLMRRYLHDFIHASFNVKSNREIDLLRQCLLASQRELQKDQPVVFDLASLHAAYEEMQARIHCLFHLIQVDCSQRSLVARVLTIVNDDDPELVSCVQHRLIVKWTLVDQKLVFMHWLQNLRMFVLH